MSLGRSLDSLLNRLGFASIAKPIVRVPILTYHSAHSLGYTYDTNDHLALEEDLRLIRRLGLQLVSIGDVVDWIAGNDVAAIERGFAVALTFDDAPDWDYFDFLHPDIGCLKSFYRLLIEHSEQGGQLPTNRGPAAVSFAIADPEARLVLDRVGMAGRGHWRDFWWPDVSATGVIGIANHSWDHAHSALPVIRQRQQRKGTFLGIDNKQDADAQISEAQRFIWYRCAGLALPYFAYPFGEVPEYLSHEYFPRYSNYHGIVAAFGTQGDYAARGQNRWEIPRFVCGQHWRSATELEGILRRAMVPKQV